MYEVTFKDNPNFTGEYGNIMFIEGKAKTDNPWVAAWFEGRGFEVEKKEQEKVGFDGLSVEELKALCSEKELEFNPKAKKDDLIKLLEGAE